MSIAEKLQTIAENEQKVFDAGVKSEHDRFWDAYQQSGKRTVYEYAFAGEVWDEKMFKPKYNMIPTGAYMMFRSCGLTGDLDEHLARAGVTLDFSRCLNAAYLFNLSKIETLGTIDLSKMQGGYMNFFDSTYLKTIRKFIPTPNIEIPASNFGTALENITVEGALSRSCNFQKCPLTVESMKSIISCLTNYVGTSKEGSYTLKFSDACWEALETNGKAPNGDTWKDYVNYTLGWAI